MLIKIRKIITLKQLIGKLRKRHTLRKLAVETLLHRVFGHHVIDRDELADVARKVDERIVFHPVVVVYELGRIGFGRMEIEEMLELRLNAGNVMLEHLFGEQVTLGRLTRGVAYHTGSATQQGDGLMPATLQMPQHHDAAEVTDME